MQALEYPLIKKMSKFHKWGKLAKEKFDELGDKFFKANLHINFSRKKNG